MGCSIGSNHCKIQRTAAIEILDEENAKSNTGNISVIEFFHNGQFVKLHFKTYTGILNSR